LGLEHAGWLRKCGGWLLTGKAARPRRRQSWSGTPPALMRIILICIICDPALKCKATTAKEKPAAVRFCPWILLLISYKKQPVVLYLRSCCTNIIILLNTADKNPRMTAG
jgi:hypothetical protein